MFANCVYTVIKRYNNGSFFAGIVWWNFLAGYSRICLLGPWGIGFCRVLLLIRHNFECSFTCLWSITWLRREHPCKTFYESLHQNKSFRSNLSFRGKYIFGTPHCKAHLETPTFTNFAHRKNLMTGSWLPNKQIATLPIIIFQNFYCPAKDYPF